MRKAYRKTLADYEREHGTISGVDEAEFNTARTQDYLGVCCQSCYHHFFSKKADLAARFNRKRQIKCIRCVNLENIKKRYE